MLRNWVSWRDARGAVVRAVAAMLLTIGVAACTDSDPSLDAESAAVPRVVSLSPALTETLVRLGLGDSLVGRTPWCDAADEAVPIVGDLMEIDAERMIAVRPTIVLVQPPKSGVDEGLRTLAQRRGWRLQTWRIDGVDDILRVIDELPAAVLPPGMMRDAAAAQALDARLAIERVLVVDPAVAAAGRTMLLFGIDPPMAFGAESYLGEVLERLGGTNAVTTRGFPQLTLEDIVRLAPDTVLLIGAAARNEHAAPLLARLGVPEDPSRVLRFDDPAALVPGPSLGRVATGLRTVLGEAQ